MLGSGNIFHSGAAAQQTPTAASGKERRASFPRGGSGDLSTDKQPRVYTEALLAFSLQRGIGNTRKPQYDKKK